MKMVRPENVGDGSRETKRKKLSSEETRDKMRKRDRRKKLGGEDKRGKKKGKEVKARKIAVSGRSSFFLSVATFPAAWERNACRNAYTISFPVCGAT